MREVVTTTKVYDIEELGHYSKERALRLVAERRHEDFMDFNSNELIESLREAGKHFYVDISNWSFGLFSTNVLRTNNTELVALDDEEKTELVEWLNDNIKSGSDGSCPFTGVCYDCYFFDYFKENGETSLETIDRDIGRALWYALNQAISDEEDSILDDEYNTTYAREMELEFTEEGGLYY